MAAKKVDRKKLPHRLVLTEFLILLAKIYTLEASLDKFLNARKLEIHPPRLAVSARRGNALRYLRIFFIYFYTLAKEKRQNAVKAMFFCVTIIFSNQNIPAKF